MSLARRLGRGFKYTGCMPEGVVGLIAVLAAPWACRCSQRSAFSPTWRMALTACSRGRSRIASAWRRFMA